MPTATASNAAPALPFPIASRNKTSFSFTVPQATLGSSGVSASPIEIPAVGYIKSITLDVSITSSGGTTPAFAADGPFNILSSISLANSRGFQLTTPMDGYLYYLMNKYGCQDTDAPYADPKLDVTYDATVTAAHFMLDVPIEISPADTFGAIPALASNRNYLLNLSFASIATAFTGSPTSVKVDVTGYVTYWSLPVAVSNGVNQQTTPSYNGSLNLWQYDSVALTAGDKYVKLVNVGNVLRTLIFVLRDDSGVRDDDDWPAISELYLDGAPQFHYPVNFWRSINGKQFALKSTTVDAAGGPDKGVYVIPFYALAEGKAIANARRSQYLPTLDASQLRLRGTSWGSSASSLQILTNSVQPVDVVTGNSLSALYGIS